MKKTFAGAWLQTTWSQAVPDTSRSVYIPTPLVRSVCEDHLRNGRFGLPSPGAVLRQFSAPFLLLMTSFSANRKQSLVPARPATRSRLKGRTAMRAHTKTTTAKLSVAGRLWLVGFGLKLPSSVL